MVYLLKWHLLIHFLIVELSINLLLQELSDFLFLVAILAHYRPDLLFFRLPLDGIWAILHFCILVLKLNFLRGLFLNFAGTGYMALNAIIYWQEFDIVT